MRYSLSRPCQRIPICPGQASLGGYRRGPNWGRSSYSHPIHRSSCACHPSISPPRRRRQATEEDKPHQQFHSILVPQGVVKFAICFGPPPISSSFNASVSMAPICFVLLHPVRSSSSLSSWDQPRTQSQLPTYLQEEERGGLKHRGWRQPASLPHVVSIRMQMMEPHGIP